MKCLYCGKPLTVLQRLAGNTFCGVAHRNAYSREDKLALARLMEARSLPSPPETHSTADAEGTEPEAESRTPWAGSLPLGVDPRGARLPVPVDDFPLAPGPGEFFPPIVALPAAVPVSVRGALPEGGRTPAEMGAERGVLAASHRVVEEAGPVAGSVGRATRPQAGLAVSSLAGLKPAGLLRPGPAASPRHGGAVPASTKGSCVWTVRPVELRSMAAKVRPPVLEGQLLDSGLPAMAANHRSIGRARAAREPGVIRTPANADLCFPPVEKPGYGSAFGSGRLADLTRLAPWGPGLPAFQCSAGALPVETALRLVFPVSAPLRKSGGAQRVRPWRRLLGIGIGARDFPCSPRFLPASSEFRCAPASEVAPPLPARLKTPSKRPRVQAITQPGRRIPA